MNLADLAKNFRYFQQGVRATVAPTLNKPAPQIFQGPSNPIANVRTNVISRPIANVVNRPAPQMFQGPTRNPLINAALPPLARTQIGLERFAARKPITIAPKVTNPALRFVLGIPEGMVNAPQASIRGAVQMGQNINQGRVTPQNFVSNAAQMAELPLMLATLGGGGQVAKGIGKQGFKALVKQGAKQGAKYGAGFGALGGLEQTANKDTVVDILKRVAVNTALGAGAGAALGGGLAGAGYGIGKGARAFKETRLATDEGGYIRFKEPPKTIVEFKSKLGKEMDSLRNFLESERSAHKGKLYGTVQRDQKRLLTEWEKGPDKFIEKYSLLPPELRSQPRGVGGVGGIVTPQKLNAALEKHGQPTWEFEKILKKGETIDGWMKEFRQANEGGQLLNLTKKGMVTKDPLLALGSSRQAIENQNLINIYDSLKTGTMPRVVSPEEFQGAVFGKPQTGGVGERLTKFDTPQIIEARRQAKTIPPTIDINTPERTKLRTKLANDFYGNGAINKNRRVDIILGTPASGKSTRLAEPLAQKYGSLIIDSDQVKKALPEFNNGIGASAIHAESALIADLMVSNRAIANGDNIVLSRLGKTQRTMEDVIDLFNENGYQIHIHHVDLPAEEAVKRVITRFNETGRFVDPTFILSEVDGKPKKVYNAVKNRKGVLSYEEFSNNVPFGQKPILTEKGENPLANRGERHQRQVSYPSASQQPQKIQTIQHQEPAVGKVSTSVAQKGRISTPLAEPATTPAIQPKQSLLTPELKGGGQLGGLERPSSGNIIPQEGDPVQKIIKALKEAKPLEKQQGKIYQEMRAKQAGAIAGIGKTVPGEKGFHVQLGQLKGEMPKVQFETIRKQITQPDIDSLFNRIEGSNVLSPFEKISAKTGLAKLLGGEGGQVPVQSELKLLSEVFPPDFIQTILSKRSTMQKLFSVGAEALNLPRAVMATADMSAPLRQGVFLIGRPKQWLPAFVEQFKYFFKEKAYQGLLDEIKSRPTYKLMRENKLALTDLSPILQNREEAFMSNLAEKIPGLGKISRASNRAYSGFLNKLRADVFDDLYRTAQKQGLVKERPGLVADIAKFVNSATGRGNIGSLEKIAPVLNGAFFSPRLMASRLNLLYPGFYVKLDPFVRKEALKSLVSFAGTGMTILGLAELGGVKVGADPRSSDFGKIKIGNTRLDIWGGFQQYIRAAGQLITGQYISSTTGREYTLGEGYKPLTRLGILGRIIESKESPIMSFVSRLLTGQSALGGKLNVPVEVIDRFIPMVVQDMYDLYKEGGMKELALGIPAIFGVGVQTYGKQIPTQEKTPSGKPTIKLKAVPGLGEAIYNKVTNTLVSNIPEAQWPQYILQKNLESIKTQMSDIRRQFNVGEMTQEEATQAIDALNQKANELTKSQPITTTSPQTQEGTQKKQTAIRVSGTPRLKQPITYKVKTKKAKKPPKPKSIKLAIPKMPKPKKVKFKLATSKLKRRKYKVKNINYKYA